jgi:RNA polymerase sigma factor (sigma-70 family)
LTVEYEQQLWAAYKNHNDLEAREQLILSYVPLTKHLVKDAGAAQACDSFDDALSEAYVALIQCVDRFDPSQGVKFATMAARRILGAVQDLARKAFGTLGRGEGRSVPVPLSSLETDEDGELVDTVLAVPDNVEAVLEKSDDSRELGQLLVSLPPNWRLVFLLFVFENVSHTDIAQALGFSYHRSVQILTHAKKRLRQHYQEGNWPWKKTN